MIPQAAIADITPGFRAPVQGAQLSFRSLLSAMSLPGRIHELPAAALAGVEPPAAADAQPLGRGMTALLLALLDEETAVHFAGALAGAGTHAYFRFHAGARQGMRVEGSPFVAVRARELDTALWSRLDIGSDEVPQRGATLVVEVDGFEGAGATPLLLRGPGVESVQPLAVGGIDRAFWAWRIEMQRAMPRGVDLVLVQGTRIAAVPRSSRIALQPREGR